MDNSVKNYYSYCDDDIIDWSQEADAVMRDVADHVKEIIISKELPPTRQESFINITTLSGKRICVKLNAQGLQIVGDDYDTRNQESAGNTQYETPYALLSDVCPSYVHSFGNSLANALNKLEQLHQDHELSDVE